jgi:hypothetical protein
VADLRGTIHVTKRVRNHPVWESNEPYCRRAAWLDLILLANDKPRTVAIHGQAIELKRGQLVWSIRSLEKEWHKSSEWITSFLKFCADHAMIKVDTQKNRGTIITILNYDVYNPLLPDTDSVSETGTKPDTDSVSETEWKVERGIGSRNKEGGSAPPPTTDFAEVPFQAEVLQFAAAYPGDLSRGIPPRISEAWALDWFAWRSSARSWPKKWRDDLTLRFVSDWVSGNAKARSAGQKNGGAPVQTDGRTPASKRFELSRELEELNAHLDALHEANVQPPAATVKREREIKAELAKLGNPQS